jgi:hypothetical protein
MVGVDSWGLLCLAVSENGWPFENQCGKILLVFLLPLISATF